MPLDHRLTQPTYKPLHLREKLDILIRYADPPRVFGDDRRLNTPEAWAEGTNNRNLEGPLGISQDEEPNDRAAKVSRILKGTRPITAVQLRSLARYLRLDRYLGAGATPSDAVELAACSLTDHISVSMFVEQLLASGWASRPITEPAPLRSRQELLDAFAELGLARDRIWVGPELVVSSLRAGPNRGVRLPRRDDSEHDLAVFAIGTHLKLRLDLDRSICLLLLELRPAAENGCVVSCLAPSPLIPETRIAGASVILPEREVAGLDCFIVDEQPLGRHDWVAVLSERTVGRWGRADESLHQPSRSQLLALVDGLRDMQARGEWFEIRHFPFWVSGA